MKVNVVFSDGLDMIIDVPDGMRHCAEFQTGRPDRVENVDVAFKGWHPSGAPIYVEKPAPHG